MFPASPKTTGHRVRKGRYKCGESGFRITPTFVTVGVFLILAGCVYKGAPTSDSTPPKIYILKWEKSPQGGQGAQTKVDSGGQFTVNASWLGAGGATNKADIKVYADDDEGVRSLEVTGTARARCSTEVNSRGQFYSSPGVITTSFPKQSEVTNPGTVKDFMVVHLDSLVASCGSHQYSGMPSSEPFLIDSGTWTITAVAENCCGGKTTATFTITIQ